MADARPGDDVEIWTGPAEPRHPHLLRRRPRPDPRRGQAARPDRRWSARRRSRPTAPSSWRRAPQQRRLRPHVDRHPAADALHGQGLHLEVEAARSVRVDAGRVPGAPRQRRPRRPKACTDIVERRQPAGDVPGGHPPERARRAGDVRRHRLRGGQGRRADHPDGHRRHRGDDAQGRRSSSGPASSCSSSATRSRRRSAPSRGACRAARSRSSPSSSTARSRSSSTTPRRRPGAPT